MTKKIFVNTFIFTGTYFIPLYLFFSYQNDINIIKKIQIPLSIIMFLGSAILIFLNHLNYKKENKKILWLLFLATGVIGLVLSGIVLFLLFSFKEGVGF